MRSSPFFVLVVEPDPAGSEAWRAAVSLARMDRQVYGVQTSSEAIEYVMKVRRSPSLSTPGVVMVESSRSRDPLSAIGRWLKSQESLFWVVPIALIDSCSREDFTEFYEAGARSCLRSPESVDERVAVLSEIRNYWQALNVWPNSQRYG